MLRVVTLLVFSNFFMAAAWYGHLRHKDRALWLVILASWGIAFFEYCLQVPANRLGSDLYTPAQLKILQEVITFITFFIFSAWYLGMRPTWNDALAGALIIAALGVSVYQPIR